MNNHNSYNRRSFMEKPIQCNLYQKQTLLESYHSSINQDVPRSPITVTHGLLPYGYDDHIQKKQVLKTMETP